MAALSGCDGGTKPPEGMMSGAAQAAGRMAGSGGKGGMGGKGGAGGKGSAGRGAKLMAGRSAVVGIGAPDAGFTEPGPGSAGTEGSAGIEGSAGKAGRAGTSEAGAGAAGSGAPLGTARTCIAPTAPASDAICDKPAGPADAAGSARPPGIGYPDDLEAMPAKVAYLTFDDGPGEWTQDFLTILGNERVHATFFVNARRFQREGLDVSYKDDAGNAVLLRDILKRAVDDGHVLGNHTVDHEDLLALDAAAGEKQLDDNERLVNAALMKSGGTARPLTLIRPPYGSPWYKANQPAPPLVSAADVGLTIQNRGFNVLWHIDSGDSNEWALNESPTRVPSPPPATIDPSLPTYDAKVARIRDAVLNAPQIAAGKGAVILFHDTHSTTGDALSSIIGGLRAAGYSFGTLEEYVMTRFGRASVEVTPGPKLYDPCTPEDKRSCEFSGDVSVCGRFWSAYRGTDAAERLGLAIAAPLFSESALTLLQPFEHGSIELHPEGEADCSAILELPSSY